MSEGDDNILEIKRTSKKEAIELLKDKEVYGIYFVKENPTLSIVKTDYYTNILEALLSSYVNNKNMVGDIGDLHPEKLPQVVKALEEYEGYVKSVSVNGKTLDFSVMFFYALMGMSCMYGAFIGFTAAIDLQANISAVAARKAVSATTKLQLILVELFTAFSMHFVNVLIHLFALKYLFKIQMEGNMWEMILVLLAGSLIGVALGICITSVSKWSENVKIGLILAISMTGCMFAGLYSNNIKYAVDEKFPFLNKLNPPALISDSFYCINVYNDGSRLATNIIILFALSAVLIVISFLAIRRESYDSI